MFTPPSTPGSPFVSRGCRPGSSLEHKHAPKGKMGFSLVELLVSMAILFLLVTILATVNDHSLRLLRYSSSKTEIFQGARHGFEVMVRQLNQSVLNAYWDYDNPEKPERYLRKSSLVFLSGPASTLLGSSYGPGQAVFFQAPMGILDDPSVRQLNLMLNTCGFFIEFGDSNRPSPGFMNLPVRNRYRLMQLQTSGENMTVYANRASNNWFTENLAEARTVAENVVLLVVRPIAPQGGSRVDLAGSDYLLDTRLGELGNPQPITANQLPPILDLTLVAVSEHSMNRIDPTDGFVFSSAEIQALFNDPASYADDMQAFEDILMRERLEYQIFRQQIALPNSKWSD